MPATSTPAVPHIYYGPPPSPCSRSVIHHLSVDITESCDEIADAIAFLQAVAEGRPVDAADRIELIKRLKNVHVVLAIAGNSLRNLAGKLPAGNE